MLEVGGCCNFKVLVACFGRVFVGEGSERRVVFSQLMGLGRGEAREFPVLLLIMAFLTLY